MTLWTKWALVVRWLALSLAGLFAYVLLRGLSLYIALGAPAYDWQWYVPVVGLLVVALAGAGLGWLRARIVWVLLAVLSVWLVAGATGFGQIERLQPKQAGFARISFWTYYSDDYLRPAILNDLRAAGGKVYLAVGAEPDPFEGQPATALAEHVRRLSAAGIETVLMPPAADFLSVPTHQEWMTSTLRAAAVVRREGLSAVTGFIGDAEPPMSMPLDVLMLDRESTNQAATRLRDMVAESDVANPDLEIGVTAAWPLYLDALDGDNDLATVMRSPVDPPGNWGFINLMAYSSYFPADWGPYYVRSLQRAMSARYPARDVSYLIGLVGGGFPWEPVIDFDTLVRDARILQALGAPEIVVFQLNGALKQFGPDFVRRLTAAVRTDDPVDVPFSRGASLLLFGFCAADSLLDLIGPAGLVFIAWMVLAAIIVRMRAGH